MRAGSGVTALSTGGGGDSSAGGGGGGVTGGRGAGVGASSSIMSPIGYKEQHNLGLLIKKKCCIYIYIYIFFFFFFVRML